MKIYYLVKQRIFKSYKWASKYMKKIKYPIIYVSSKKELGWLKKMKKKNKAEDDEIEELINR